MRTSRLLKLTTCLSALVLQLTVVISIDVVGRIAWNGLLSDIRQIPIDSKVKLRSGTPKEAFIRQDGTFVLQDVKPGKYILSVQCRTFAFPSLSVQVPESDPSGSISVVPIIKHHVYGKATPPQPAPGASPAVDQRLHYPIQLTPVAKIQYEDIKAAFNPIAMLLGNPLYLLMGGMAIFMMIMPKLMDMMDPEAMAEVHASQANMRKQMASMQDMDFTSGLSNILSAPGGEDGAPESSPKAVRNTGKSTAKANDNSPVKRRK